MSPIAFFFIACLVPLIQGKYQSQEFIYKGSVAFSDRLPALKEILASSEVNTLSYCASQCRMHLQCTGIEICYQKVQTLCRLSTSTNPVFTANKDNGKQSCRLLQMESALDETESWSKNLEPVFLAKSGNGERTYDAWKRQHTATGCATTNGCLPSGLSLTAQTLTGKHLTSPLISDWTSIGVRQVYIQLYKNGARVAYFVFDGEGSDMMNWFSASRLLDSSYTDISPNSTFNMFSIEGEYWHANRRFFINHRYGGCDKDEGWMFITDARLDSFCSFDQHIVYPQILYGNNNKKTRWGNGTFGLADSMTIQILRE